MARASRRAASSVSMRGMDRMIRGAGAAWLPPPNLGRPVALPAPGPCGLEPGALIRAGDAPMPLRTICQAIEDAARAEPTRGFRFVPETGVPGFSAPGAPA